MARSRTEEQRFEERRDLVTRELGLLIAGADRRGRRHVLEKVRGFGQDLIARGNTSVAVKLLGLCDELEREADRLET